MNLIPVSTARLAGCLLLLLTSLPQVPLQAQGDILTAERLGVDRGLLSNQAFCTLQDRKGFIWFGAVPGLARFDGRDWEYFRSERTCRSGPSSLVVNDFCEDRQGNLWLGTGLGLDCFDPRRRTFRYFLPGLSGSDRPGTNSVRAVRILSALPGTLWIGSNDGGLYSMDLHRLAIHRWGDFSNPVGEYRGNRVYAMLEDRRGWLWVATDQGLNGYDPRRRLFTFHPLPVPRSGDGIPETTCLFESESRPGTIWICTRGAGLLGYDSTKDRWQVFSGTTGLPNDYVYLAVEWPHGGKDLLLSTDEGFCRLDPESGRNTPVTLMADNQKMPKQLGQLTATVDRSGVLWLTSVSQGVFKIVKRLTDHFSHYDSPAPDAPDVDWITMDHQGRIWLNCNYATNRFRIFRGDPRSAVFHPVFASPEGSFYSWGRTILLSRDGIAWIGTSHGLIRLDPETGTSRTFRPDPDLPDTRGLDSAEYLVETPSGNIWLGTHEGVLAFDPVSGQCRRFFHDSARPGSLSDSRINCLLVDRSGVLWVGSPGGLDRYLPESGRFVSCNTGSDGQPLSDSRVTVLLQDRKKRFWVGTGHGLNQMMQKDGVIFFRRYILPGGEPNNLIHCLVDDDQGNLWIGTPKGLNCLPDGGDGFLFFDHSDGLPPAVFTILGGQLDLDGRLWLAGRPGFVSFRPRDLFNRWPVPETSLTAVRLDGEPAGVGPGRPLAEHPPFAREVTVPADVRSVSLTWAAFDYVRPERTQFAWRFAGGDGKWRENGFDNTVALSGLEPGRHTIQVRAANHNGRWSPEWAELAITVLPPWWRTKAFLLAAAALLLAAVLAVWQALSTYKRKLTRTLADVPAGSDPDLGKYDVSSREMEVLRLVLRGRSNREIEDALFISASTVKTHLRNIYRKLGVKSRLQLINFMAARIRKPQ